IVRPEQFSYQAQGRRRSNAAVTAAAMTTCIDSPSRAQPGSDDSCQSGMDDSFGMTVASTIACRKLDFWLTAPSLATSILPVSSVSTPSFPMRLSG
ncbi:hypothetical protein COLO4_01302, partial [Corchorus olitorius]